MRIPANAGPERADDKVVRTGAEAWVTGRGRRSADAPAVAVRVAEEDEADVVQSVSLPARPQAVGVVQLDLTDIHASLDELSACSRQVRHDQLEALQRT
jgi:hypothetical protein